MAVSVAAAFLDEKLQSWTSPRPLVLGISGPQGSGKSFLAENLLRHIQQTHPGLRCVGALIDDFYLTHAEQSEVSARAKQAGNMLLQGRGLPGTHDLPLALLVLQKLRVGQETSIPLYDKSAFLGAGDRAPADQWQTVPGPVDVVIFEGWFVGFQHIDSASFAPVYFAQGPDSVVQRSPMHQMANINARLADYEPLWAQLDFCVCLSTPDIDFVYQWRLQQEQNLIARTGAGMGPQAVTAFVDRYMPLYYLYYWRMVRQGAARSGHNLVVAIDIQRRVTGQQVV